MFLIRGYSRVSYLDLFYFLPNITELFYIYVGTAYLSFVFFYLLDNKP